jgi:hypothetical protein
LIQQSEPSLYQRLLMMGLRSLALPIALISGLDTRQVSEISRGLSEYPRTFAKQDEALALIGVGCGVIGGCSAFLGITVALVGSLTSTPSLFFLARVFLSVLAPGGVLLVVTRLRSNAGNRRYGDELNLPQGDLTVAEPKSWEPLLMTVAYGISFWLSR